MSKIVLVLCVVLAVAKGHEVQEVTTDNSLLENFIKGNRSLFNNFKRHVEKRVNITQENYMTRIKQHETAVVKQVFTFVDDKEENLKAFASLSTEKDQCITKYRSAIPSVADINSSFASCKNQTLAELASLIVAPITQRDTLQNYFLPEYERSITSCATNFPKTTTDYASCIIKVTTKAQADTTRTFITNHIIMTLNERKNKAFTCFNAVLERTKSQYTEVYKLITNCSLGTDSENEVE